MAANNIENGIQGLLGTLDELGFGTIASFKNLSAET